MYARLTSSWTGAPTQEEAALPPDQTPLLDPAWTPAGYLCLHNHSMRWGSPALSPGGDIEVPVRCDL